MDNRKTELLDYIRTLYDRQSSKASKAGMTHWAILAGVIYVTWHLLQTLADLQVESSSRLAFYHAFSQVHLALLSISFLIASGGAFQRKRELDYRVLREDRGGIVLIFLLLVFLGSPLYTTYQLRSTETNVSFFQMQATINFWTLTGFCTLFLTYSLYEGFKRKNNPFPPVSTLISGESKISKIVPVLTTFLFFELFLGNTLNIAINVYGSVSESKLQTAALDVSLIMFGTSFLFRRGKTDERLDRLARFERDILIHNLTEKEILDRLQDEHLGRYVGDWIGHLLTEVRGKGEKLSNHSDRVEKFITEVDKIDEAYELERKGRIDEYLGELEEKNDVYQKSITPLIEWLKKAGIHASFDKDTFMQSIIESSINELQESSTEVNIQVKNALGKLREWLNNSRQKDTSEAGASD